MKKIFSEKLTGKRPRVKHGKSWADTVRDWTEIRGEKQKKYLRKERNGREIDIDSQSDPERDWKREMKMKNIHTNQLYGQIHTIGQILN